ncbi:MAG: discoidin domain-containing protein [Candidatus Binatia bacterium]
MRARLGVPLFWLAVSVGAAVWWTWPLGADLGAGYLFPREEVATPSRADVALITWMMAWSGHALRTQPLHLFDANIWYPIANAMCFSEHMLGAAAQVFPLQVIGMDPVAIHNLFLIGSFVLGAVGAALVVRDLGGSWTGGCVAGALFAFGPYRSGLVGHAHMIGTHLMPFVFLFLQRLLRDARWRDGALFVVVYLLQVLTSVYHLYYFSVGIGAFIAGWALCRAPTRPGSYRRVAVCLGVAAMIVLPTMLPYAAMRERFALARDPMQTIWFSSVGLHFVGALLSPIAHYRARLLGDGVTPAVVGVGALVAIVGGTIGGATSARGGRRVGLVYLLTALALTSVALGPWMRMTGPFAAGFPGPYALLQRLVPGFDGLRVPGRAAIGALCAFAILAGLGTSALARLTRTRTARALVMLLAAGLVASEVWPPAPLFLLRLPWGSESPGVYRWLAGVPGGDPIIELPIGRPDLDAGYMVRSTAHWRPMLNGYTGFAPAATYLRALFYPFPDPSSQRLLVDLGVRYAILHPAELPAPRANVCTQIASGKYPGLAVRYADRDTCAVEILGAPPAPVHPPDRLVPRTALTLTASNDADARAAADGDLATHWIDDIDEQRDAWLQVDLASPRRLRRLVLHLGPHFGEFLRIYRVETSVDGTSWTPVVAPGFGEAPLRGMRTDPEHLAVEIALPDVTTQHLRIVRPRHADPTGFDLWANWRRWGVHELEVYEAS